MRKYEYETMEDYEKRMKNRKNIDILNFVLYLIISILSIFILLKFGIYNTWLYIFLPILVIFMFLSDYGEVSRELNYQKELEYRKNNKK